MSFRPLLSQGWEVPDVSPTPPKVPVTFVSPPALLGVCPDPPGTVTVPTRLRDGKVTQDSGSLPIPDVVYGSLTVHLHSSRSLGNRTVLGDSGNSSSGTPLTFDRGTDDFRS